MRYSVLLIDDHQIALEALKQTIPWEELDLCLVGCAYDGKQGCEMIAKHQPNIVISDIHMPEMSGLSMIEKMQSELSFSRVIFITAYEKIEYASRAIRLSAFDFLIKPIDNREVIQSLQRAIKSLDDERNNEERHAQLREAARRARFLSALSAGPVDNQAELLSSFLKEVPKQYFFIVAESPGGLSGPQLQRLEYAQFDEPAEIVTTVADGELVLLCSLRETNTAWQIIAKRIGTELQQNLMNLTVAISSLWNDPKDFYAAYQEGRCALLRHNLYGSHTEIEFSDDQRLVTQKHAKLSDFELSLGKLAQRIDSIDPEEVWRLIVDNSKGKMRITRIQLMLFCTKVMQDKIAHNRWVESVDMTVYDITRLHNEAEAHAWLTRFIQEVQQYNSNTVSSALVQSVLDYVRKHITDGLSLEAVANLFFVSPNYLSSLIRKEIGITYRQYVVNAKVALAKQMLNDTRMNVEAIAYALGYENYISFYNIFKKTENMSPSEYRLHSPKEGVENLQ